jgi:multidrug efflux pump subunit AcrA (membrane-fusion protein)
LISQQDYADLQTAWDVARSNLDVERLQAEATLAEARTLQAQLRMAEQRLHDTLHVAPQIVRGEEPSAAADDPARLYDVAERLVYVGDFVQIGSPLLRLVDADPVKLRAQVPERRLGDVKVDQAAKVRVESYAEPFAGRVWRVSPAVDMTTRNFMVEILIANPDGKLKPGSFATADIEVGREMALCVPESSVIAFAGVTKVVLVRDGKAAEQRIELGERSNGLIEVRKGLEAGDQVVVRPSASLTTGTPVTINHAGATAAGTGRNAAPSSGETTP